MPTTRDLDAELDERMQRFTARGVSRAAMLAQLNLAGYPVELLRQRFPEMSNVAFGDALRDHPDLGPANAEQGHHTAGRRTRAAPPHGQPLQSAVARRDRARTQRQPASV